MHQDTCVNATAALLCPLYIQVTSLLSCLFFTVTNAFQQLSWVHTSVFVQTPVYMAEDSKSTRARSLPLVAFFNPLHKLELKADWGLFPWGGAACSAPLCDGQYSTCISLGIPCSYFTLSFAKQTSIGRDWNHPGWFRFLFLTPFSKIKTNFLQAVYPGFTLMTWFKHILACPSLLPHCPHSVVPAQHSHT